MARGFMRAGRVFVGITFPLLLIGILLYLLQSPGGAQPEAAPTEEVGLSAAFEMTAGQYRQQCEYAALERLCQDALTAPLSSAQALRIRQILAEVYIEVGQDQIAEQMTEQIIADFSREPALVGALCGIGDTWRAMRQFDRAKAIYQRITAEQADNPDALWARQNLCTMAVQLHQDSEAQTETDRLASDFARHPRLALALCSVGDAYLRRKDFPQAMELYRYAVEHLSGTADAVWAQKNICTTLIRQKDFDAVPAETDRLADLFAKNPDLARALCEVGDALANAKQSEQAAALYEYVVAHFPTDEYALWSQKNLCTLYAGLGQQEQAEAELKDLFARFGENKLLARVLCEVGDACRKAENFARAVELYEYITNQWPGDEYAVWAQKNIVTLLIEQDDLDGAAISLETLLETYAECKELPQTLLDVCDAYRKKEFFTQSRKLCEQISRNYPGTTHDLWARQKSLLNDIDISEQAVPPPGSVPEPILQAMDQFIVDFASYPQVTFAVFMTGEAYYDLAHEENDRPKPTATQYYPKAIEIWQKIITGDLPIDRTSTPEAWFLSGVCLSRCKKPAEAIPYIQTVLNDWPDYHYTWDAQVFLGVCYEQLKWANRKKPDLSYDALIEEAYTAVLERFPDCTLVFYANLQLSELKYEQQRWAEAAMHAERYLQDKFIRPTAQRAGVLYKLGLCYENLHEPDLARAAFQQHIDEFPEGKLPTHAKAVSRLAALEGGAQ
ncbi:MAG: tetratricopeptide repeat protein [Sedimentisphaerales bacterium]|nr:tetratricopeptide repeat protein [Sedimentisphaerales bacterium]